jgi:murein L,D-transpeptidase YafK
MIRSWEKAWEEQDLNAYISHYDSQFQSGEMDLAAWGRYKRKLNHKYQYIEVGIRDLEIEQTSSRTATLHFKQSYRADKYEDFGLKHLFLVKRGNGWKIKKEEWEPLAREPRL